MIVPISIIGNSRMEPCLRLLTETCVWMSSYSGDTHPGTLFSGVQQNLCIFVSSLRGPVKCNATEFIRFADGSGEREIVFSAKIEYWPVGNVLERVEKIGTRFHGHIVEKLLRKNNKLTLIEMNQIGRDMVYYHDVVHYWVKAFSNVPYFKREGCKPEVSGHYKVLCCQKNNKKIIAAILSSTLFYMWYLARSNGRDVAKDDVLSFPIDIMGIFDNSSVRTELLRLAGELCIDFERNKERVTYRKQSGSVTYDQYWVSKSKPIIDEIDELLAKHYGFTEEELDFIINYDIKYRMGDRLNEEE